MCGIVGFARRQQDPRPAWKTVGRMAALIAHRGPDGEGFYVDEQVALGHRRLSIIDLAGGSQPMFNEDGTLVAVFNGEIYNFAALRSELQAAGHRFATRSDTEVLLHGYEEWGAALPGRLRGMFAFVLWDKNTRTLFGARDIFGIKPLYYHQAGDLLLFGSEIKSFLAHPDFRCELNEERLPDYLSIEYLPDAETLFRGVFQLPPAHRFTWHAGALRVEPYYQILYRPDEGKTLAQWEQKITETFAGSVAAHQAADVEVGCFLSGGVDSSLVVQQVAKGNPRVKSFTVGYAERQYSELPYAQAFSRQIGVPCFAATVDAERFFGANRLIQWMLDEPLPNPAEIPLYFLAQNAARQVKVVLSGEGADELFGGYPLYSQAVHFMAYERRTPAALRRALGDMAAGLPAFRGRNFLVRGAQQPWQRCMRANYVFANTAQRDRYLNRAYRCPTPEQRFKPWFDRSAGLDEPTQLQWVDLHTWMPYDILLKADRMSMANSLELRVPFLDREMLELALAIPQRYRTGKRQTKIALRRAALAQLPPSVAGRRKLGFPVPLDAWLRQDRYASLLREAFHTETARRFFDTDALCRLLDDHHAGRTHAMTQLWSFYSFIQWYEEFFVRGLKGRNFCAKNDFTA